MSAASLAALVVRRAESGDLEQVLAIEEASFADPWTLDAFRTSLVAPHLRFLVAEEEAPAGGAGAGGVVGYVLAIVMGPEGEIADIAVAPRARGRGVGGVLLDRITDLLVGAGVRTIYLEVRESNLAARQLYEGRAFLMVGRRKGYYQHPVEDALVLRREIGPG